MPCGPRSFKAPPWPPSQAACWSLCCGEESPSRWPFAGSAGPDKAFQIKQIQCINDALGAPARCIIKAVLTKLHCAAAVGILLIVLVIFVFPAVDLPATALRAQQASMLLVVSIALCARLPFMRNRIIPVRQTSTHYSADSASISGPSSLTGVLLC